MDIATTIQNLFNEASSEHDINYIFTLVRVDYIDARQDPLIQLSSALKTVPSELSDKECLALYCSFASYEEPFNLVANLLNCTRRQSYFTFPFDHIDQGASPNISKPTPSQIARELVSKAKKDGKLEMAQLIDEVYPEDIFKGCVSKDPTLLPKDLRNKFQRCCEFLTVLLDKYFNARLGFRNQPRFYKLPHFEVIELLINKEYGLYGFRMHFSNGNYSVFERHPDSTVCINIRPGTVPITFTVGDLQALRDEWKVGDKRLYEIGLPGRYNKLGEWKPLVYPGKYDDLAHEARASSPEGDVQGALFYIMCTGHRVIEFVVRTNIDLPKEYIKIGNKFHLYKCPSVDTKFGQYAHIYDGWLELDSVDPNYIRSAISSIGTLLNRMAFVYDKPLTWQVKYTMLAAGYSYAQPSEDDLQIFEQILRDFPQAEGTVVLNAAIDWYNHGKLSKNIFTAFLCYYIAMESVALSVASGNAQLGIKYSKDTKEQADMEKIFCIEEKIKTHYPKDPLRFVKEAYFECVVGISKKTRRVVELVFGSNHKYIDKLFKKTNENSLNDIRGKLAHGEITLLSREDENLVRNRLHEVEIISKEFLMRLIFQLKPTDPLPSWSQLHAMSVSFADPRNTFVATDDKTLPKVDWRIKPEWCE